MAHAAKLNALTDDLISAINPSTHRVRLLFDHILSISMILILSREMPGKSDI
jgi:hypothetical protein